MNISEKLMNIQTELKAPKSQFNSFGKYKYRNLEDILEALKPLLKEYKAMINITDEIALVGERYYVKATATLINAGGEIEDSISSTAYAREDENKKGMDLSQLTGSTSSYARKYALNGLFAIDDTKDADTTNEHGRQESTKYKPNVPTTSKVGISEKQLGRLYAIAGNKGIDPNTVKASIKQKLNKEVTDLTRQEYDTICKAYEGMEAKK